jgi:CRISPR-associated protein Cas1
MQKDGRVLYLKETLENNLYYNIPIANTTVILLGKGTSITHAAMRMLSQARVIVGFTGTGGTPLLMGNEVEWITPQSEYRPTEYVQNWCSFWFNEEIRLEVAKELQIIRINFILKIYKTEKIYNLKEEYIFSFLENSKDEIINSTSITKLLSIEGNITKKLYSFFVSKLKIENFSRNTDSNDKFNEFLNFGNYLAYGSGAITIWVLGIPAGFAVMHGKTRRGALVFDIADLIKDSLILPWAFICTDKGMSEQAFRQQCLQNFTKHKALDFMFNTVKQMAKEGKSL